MINMKFIFFIMLPFKKRNRNACGGSRGGATGALALAEI